MIDRAAAPLECSRAPFGGWRVLIALTYWLAPVLGLWAWHRWP